MKRLFICTCAQVPFGDACSNYIRNFALAVKTRGLGGRRHRARKKS